MFVFLGLKMGEGGDHDRSVMEGIVYRPNHNSYWKYQELKSYNQSFFLKSIFRPTMCLFNFSNLASALQKCADELKTLTGKLDGV